MSGFRQLGPLCGDATPASLDDGTLGLLRSPIPGPVGAASPWAAASGSPWGWTPATEPGPADPPWWCTTVLLLPDVRYLFNSCRNPERGLSETDYAQAATDLGVEVAAIKAVAEVETAGEAFDEMGRPRILYERHYFHRFTNGRFDKSNPTLSNKSAGGYGKFSAQYGKLEEAYQLDPTAALKSASWGRFQIMGSNHAAAGHATVQEFVDALARSEAAHLQAFVAFVGANATMKAALQKKNWATFAKAYNGPKYAENEYDTKMAAAYARLAPPAPPATRQGPVPLGRRP